MSPGRGGSGVTTPDLPAIDVLFTAEDIAARVETLAGEIAATMAGDVVVIPVLKGGFVFAADLLRALHRAGMRLQVDFIGLASYGVGTESSGAVTLTREPTDGLNGRDVLLVDDILESGRTIAAARNMLLERGARSVKICMLLDKPGKRKVAIEADYRGFDVGDRFVVGYGLDYAHYFRDLPYIGALVR